MHYHIHKELQDAAIWTWPSSKSKNGQTKVNIEFVRDFDVENNVHKVAWPWDSLKVRKGHTKVNVELVRDFYVENIHVTLQHDTGNLRKVIAFTRSSQMLTALKIYKGHTKIEFGWEHPCNVTTWYRQSIKSYRIHKVPDAQATTIPFSLRGLRGKKLTACHFSGIF